ncbi:hypothetical protein L1987_02150 [Smallanthus sonchifolius]|uniref:Uncharacterized protein n=1 Tax=Smallanthus sonchifolius TaxID=185202 RepID=A0ACB9K783_9ASTR|nr:hypothetical protein L1987_02150 [Smallanthus sonchifolius]
MLELNLEFRSVAFLFLTSICFTSLVQYIGNSGRDIEHKIDNIRKYNTITVPDQDTYDINRLRGNVNRAVNSTPGDSSVSKYNGLLLPYRLWPEETLDRVSSAVNCSELIRSYNPYVDFSLGSGLAYIPGRDPGYIQHCTWKLSFEDEPRGIAAFLRRCSFNISIRRKAALGISTIKRGSTMYIKRCM